LVGPVPGASPVLGDRVSRWP